MKKSRLFVLIAAVLLLLSLPVLGAASGPYGLSLSWTGDPATTITAVWQNDTQHHEVLQVISQAQYDKTGFADAMEFPAACKDVSLDGSGAWHYEATADGLTPATAYVYRVGCQEGWSKTHRFTTEDPASESLTFAYMGDVQPVNDSAAEFALWGKLTESLYQRHPELRFAVLGGDIVNSGISLAQFHLFFQNAEPVFSNVPLFSTIGNHESNFISGKAELFLDLFAFPQNGPDGFQEEFYSFDAGSCHIVVVNSWIFSGEQKLTAEDFDRISAWLKDDLATSTGDWQIVITHLPGYAVHSDANAQKMKEAWVSIFEDYGVDLVLEGHQHVYSRSYPMYRGKIDYENGIPYIMGVSGSKFYDSADETLAERTIYNTATYQLIHVDGNMLTVQTMDAEGNELDHTTVQQRNYIPNYTDVTSGSWYEPGVAYVTENRLFSAAGGNIFAPETPMTRLMLIQALYRLAGSPPVSTGSPFDDCSDKAVAWAYGAGVVNGKGGAKFDPYGSITRQEMAAMFYRYEEKVTKADISPGSSLAGYTDKSDVAPWAQESMQWAVGCGLIKGTSHTTLTPSGTATRAQAAVITMRFAKGG